MTTLEIVKKFIKLNDKQKKMFITNLKKDGADKKTLEALDWLANMSNKQFKDTLFEEIHDDVKPNHTYDGTEAPLYTIGD